MFAWCEGNTPFYSLLRQRWALDMDMGSRRTRHWLISSLGIGTHTARPLRVLRVSRRNSNKFPSVWAGTERGLAGTMVGFLASTRSRCIASSDSENHEDSSKSDPATPQL